MAISNGLLSTQQNAQNFAQDSVDLNVNGTGMGPFAPGHFIELTQVHHPMCNAHARVGTNCSGRSPHKTATNPEKCNYPACQGNTTLGENNDSQAVLAACLAQRQRTVDEAESTLKAAAQQLTAESFKAVEAIEYITEHLKQDDQYKKIRDDWKYVAMVIDRLLLYIFFGVTAGGTLAHCSDHEQRLMVDLFKDYNSLVQPIKTKNDTPVTVKLALQLVLLINVVCLGGVWHELMSCGISHLLFLIGGGIRLILGAHGCSDEKNQIMHTNVWLTLKWYDYHMRWPTDEYGGIEIIRVAPDKVWLPDIVLFNNADGNYEVSYYSNVVVSSDGQMLWVPPAIYKSSCIIDVEFFPFDEQTCHLIFGSWTYNEREVKLELDSLTGVDLSQYSVSSIWDVVDVPAVLVSRRSRIDFIIRIRRKTLFYTVVLIIPTVLMAFLNMAVFFLPADSGEKITLTISVLLSINVFLLLIAKILPPTSKTIPLMAKYLLLTLVLNVFTIFVTVVILNVYFRGPTTHRMPDGSIAPSAPLYVVSAAKSNYFGDSGHSEQPTSMKYDYTDGKNAGILLSAGSHPTMEKEMSMDKPLFSFGAADSDRSSGKISATGVLASFYPLTPDANRAVEAVDYITEHLKQDEEYQMIREDWKYVAMIIDRLLLYVFFGVTLGGTLGIFLSAPNVFDIIDQERLIDTLLVKYAPGPQ